MTVIDSNEARAARERPDADQVQHDQFGRPMYGFALTYEMDGSTRGTEVWAYWFDDPAPPAVRYVLCEGQDRSRLCGGPRHPAQGRQGSVLG